LLSVTLVRHGQSKANTAEIWQGHGDSELSDEGWRQVRHLAERLSRRRFDLVVSSDLVRAADTALAIGDTVETDRDWREMDLGLWEGRTFDEVSASHPDLLDAIRRGEVAAMGETGETLPEFEERALAAFDRLIERVGEGEILIATHGGVVDAIVGRYLGRIQGRKTFPLVSNTAITTLLGEPPDMRLVAFNDATHLGADTGFVARARREQFPIVGFLRHGVTRANKENRIQGQSCWGLDDEGREQAAAFAAWYGPVDHVISSPLRRALETAGVFTDSPQIEDTIQEMSFGEWEGILSDELRSSGDALARKIYDEGQDLPRGRTGESFAQLIRRMGGFLEMLEADHSRRTLVVSHGAAIRALIASITENPSTCETVATPLNTAVSHVAIAPWGPMVVDFSLAPHLEVVAAEPLRR